MFDVDVDPSTDGATFKYQCFSLTGVEPSRQKILIKGGQLKDDTAMSSLPLKSGQTVMMMGSVGELPVQPPTKVAFLEDLHSEDLAKALKVPAGLQNLGNTCYMNSTLQFLRSIPEVKVELDQFQGRSFGSGSGPLVAGLRDLYQQMDKTVQGFPPIVFLQLLRSAFPQFSEMREGHYAQQDAEECWSQLVTTLRSERFMDGYMAGKMHSVLACDEDDEKTESDSVFLKLDCHISIKTNYMNDGIIEALTEKMEKRSEKLGRDAMYTKTSKITQLPKYLVVHFVRFFWRRDVNKKTKIMRKVKFPMELDATEFCEDQYRNELIPVRDRVRDIFKDREIQERAAKRSTTQNNTDETGKSESTAADNKADDEIEKTLDVGEDAGKICGLYDLVGVLTHSGPSASSGHWQAWIKQDNGSEKWWQFNDDKLREHDSAKIQSLDGGGESDAAYLLLYKAKSL